MVKITKNGLKRIVLFLNLSKIGFDLKTNKYKKSNFICLVDGFHAEICTENTFHRILFQNVDIVVSFSSQKAQKQNNNCYQNHA